MIRLACSFLLSTSLAIFGFSDFPPATQDNKNTAPPQKPETASLKQPLAFGLEDGTPIKLRLTRNLSSADATTGDRVDFPVKFQSKVVTPAVTNGTANVADTLSSVDVKSAPDGAEITVDDKYMGSTPSTLKLVSGDHKIKLEKSGFKAWERTLAVGAGGSANVNATLEKE